MTAEVQLLREKFPSRFLTVAFVLTAIGLFGLVRNIYFSYKSVRITHEQNLRIRELYGVIIHLDEVLTMSAKMAAATGDLRWEERYLSFEPHLDAAIKEAKKLAPYAYSEKAVDMTDVANQKLVKMEKRSFELIGENKRQEAMALLSGKEYEQQKQIYKFGITRFAGPTLELRLQELRGQLAYLNEAISMTIRMAVTTQNREWKERYELFQPQLYALLREAAELAPNRGIEEVTRQLEGTNQKIIALDEQALMFLEKGRVEEARDAVLSSDYEELKRENAGKIARFNLLIHKYADSLVESSRNKTLLSMFAAAVIVIALLMAWLAVVQALRRWRLAIMENHRKLYLRTTELAELNRSLDQRISEKTTKLRKANERLEREVAERRTMEAALRLIVEEISAVMGEAFFKMLVSSLSKILEVRYAIITEITDFERRRVRTLAVWMGDSFGENFEYSLEGTPCENVVGRMRCFYQERVRELFPNDPWLAKIGAESYLGIPLFDFKNNPIGHLAILDTKSMRENPHHEMILKMLAARASAEMERMAVMLELEQREERERLIIDTAYDAFVSINAKGVIVEWNKRAEEIFGWTREEALGMTMASLLIPLKYRMAHEKGMRAFLEKGEGPVLNKRIHVLALRRSGAEFPVELTIGSPVQMKDGYIFHAFIRDLSAESPALPLEEITTPGEKKAA
ncbi:MAG: PAS domain S-box protein [Deltaproteobacteria bacterium]|nr:PAS domain S-box protein [Deltaproteobacteria bacterium]